MDHDALARVIDDVVAPNAESVDRDARYPRENLRALADIGVLGLISSTDVGGGGADMRAAADVVEHLAAVCGTTAMVVMMHYSATAAIEARGPMDVRRAIADGRHLTTLAFSEAGSRSHFWAPLSTAEADGGKVRLDAEKSWVTSAGEADSYVWSSRPVAADGPMTLWLVPGGTDGLHVAGPFDGLGLRGNASKPITAKGAVVDESAMLGPDGAGLGIALEVVLPWFLVLNAAAGVGLMEAVTAEAVRHVTGTRLHHLDQALSDQPLARSDIGRLKMHTDSARAFLADTLAAVEQGRDDAQLRVLEVKAVCGEAAIAATDLAMKVCGGAAFRRELGVERRFRDARAARVMAPTTDALVDFVGRAISGLSLLDA